jgi:WD40 repeat protein/serine/threonine protein kinase
LATSRPSDRSRPKGSPTTSARFARPDSARARRDEAPSDQPLQPGNEFGDFKLVRWIARGGMGQVWEAEQKSLRRRVALKLVLPERVDESSLSLFAREARAGGRLHHPHIVATHAHGSDDGRAWLAQELVEGSWTLKDSLDQLRAADEVPPDYYRSVAELVAKIADALEAAHAAGVIHRDVKPPNVLITDDDEPKLTDFGLARITDEQALSRTGDFAGTYYYMSPEQVTARRMGIDHGTDIFSLGVVLYELLTLRRPFEGDTTHQICEKIVTWDPPDPRRVRSQCPGELGVICGKAMQKARGERYATMAEFAEDLRRHLAHEPILARPPGPWTRVTKWARRHPTQSIGTAIGLVATAVIAVVGLAAIRNADLASERADLLEEETALAERRAYSSYLHAAQMALEVGHLAEARRIHGLCPEPLRNWEWEHLGLALDPSLMTLDEHEGPVTAVVWSPDGARIASTSEDGTLRIWSASTGAALATLEGHEDDVLSVAWSPDGARLVSGSRDGTFRLWDAGSGETIESWAASRSSQDQRPVAWSRDGARLVSAYRGQLTLRDGRTGALLDEGFAQEPDWITAVGWSPDATRLAEAREDAPVRLRNASSGETLATLPIQTSALGWSPDGARLATGHRKVGIQLWDVESGGLVRTFGESLGPARSLVWSPDGTRIAGDTSGNSIGIWDAATGASLQTLRGHDELITSVAWSLDGERLVSGSEDGTLRIWDASSGPGLQTLTAHGLWLGSVAAYPTTVEFSASGERILTASWDVRIWDAATGEGLALLDGHGPAAWSPDASQVVALDADERSLRIWDAATGELGGSFEGPGTYAWVLAVSWSPDGSRIAAGGGGAGGDGGVWIWDPRSGETLHRFEGNGGWTNPFAWSPDGARLAFDGPDETLRIVDVVSGRTLQQLSGTAPVAWSPDGTRLVFRTSRRELCTWDLAAGQRIASMEGHAGVVMSAAWSPDGSRVVSSGNDNMVRVWDATTGESLQTLSVEGWADDLDWSPDGARIVANTAFQMRIWETRRDDALRLRRAEDRRRRVRPLVEDLFEQHQFDSGRVQSALKADPSLPWDLRAAALEVARWQAPSGTEINSLVWDLVGPDRDDGGVEVERALHLAEAGLVQTPRDADLRDTYAWALFANGRFDEALAQSELGVSLSLEQFRARHQESHEDLRRRVAERRAEGAPLTPGGDQGP